jgi:predicted N-acetyltransferase YhbS
MKNQRSNQIIVKIRPMEPRDIGAIFEIDRILTGDERAISLSYLITEDLGGELDLSFTADINDQLAGFIIARHAYIGEPVMDAVLIHGLGVHPIYQRIGIGTKLMNALMKQARLKGIKTLRVMLSERDTRIKNFFSKMEFKPAQFVVYDKVLKN